MTRLHILFPHNNKQPFFRIIIIAFELHPVLVYAGRPTAYKTIKTIDHGGNGVLLVII
jgi:hypothetical protein